VSTELERVARRAWVEWGEFAKFTLCDVCGELCYCRRCRGGTRWLCLLCHDLGSR